MPADARKMSTLPVATGKSWSVGDHCYWLDTKPDGGRVIADGQIVGKESREGWGERISISNTCNTAATGGPLLNERGEVIGFLGGTLAETLVPRISTDVRASFHWWERDLCDHRFRGSYWRGRAAFQWKPWNFANSLGRRVIHASDYRGAERHLWDDDARQAGKRPRFR